jgi:hypothetical protein
MTKKKSKRSPEFTLIALHVGDQLESITQGRFWAQAHVPDSMYETKFGYDGSDWGPLGKGTKGKREYRLFWYPKTLKSAMELMRLGHKARLNMQLRVTHYDRKGYLQ